MAQSSQTGEKADAKAKAGKASAASQNKSVSKAKTEKKDGFKENNNKNDRPFKAC